MSNPIPSRASLRKLLESILPTDSDVRAFCVDYFASTAKKFAEGMDQTSKLSLLLEREEPSEIVDALKQHDPNRFQKSKHLSNHEASARTNTK